MIKKLLIFLTFLAAGMISSCAVMDLSNNQSAKKAPADDGTAPTPGNSGNLKALQVLGDSMTISWMKASDPGSAAGNLQYQVFYSTNNDIDSLSNAQTNGILAMDWTLDTDKCKITNLSNLTTYYLMVLVKDEWGNVTNYNMGSRKTVTADGNYLPNPSFEDDYYNYWNFNWYLSESGIMHLQGPHIRSGSYGMYMYTSWNQRASQNESWLDFTDRSRGKSTICTIPWNEGESAVAYAWHKVWYIISNESVANYHIIVTFYSSGFAKLYTQEQRAFLNENYTTIHGWYEPYWETNNFMIITPPAPSGTAYAEVTVGLWKAAGDDEQIMMSVDDVYLSVVTN